MSTAKLTMFIHADWPDGSTADFEVGSVTGESISEVYIKLAGLTREVAAQIERDAGQAIMTDLFGSLLNGGQP